MDEAYWNLPTRGAVDRNINVDAIVFEYRVQQSLSICGAMTSGRFTCLFLQDKVRSNGAAKVEGFWILCTFGHDVRWQTANILWPQVSHNHTGHGARRKATNADSVTVATFERDIRERERELQCFGQPTSLIAFAREPGHIQNIKAI